MNGNDKSKYNEIRKFLEQMESTCLLLSKAATQNYSILTANITKQGHWFLRNKAISCIDPPAFRMLGFRNQLFIKGLIIE